jgi:Putative auto-transporter adhesin, head GIN domain
VRDRVNGARRLLVSIATIVPIAAIMTLSPPLLAKDKLQTQDYAQPAFSSVSVQIPADVEIKSSTRQSVTVTAEPKVIAALQISVRNGVLMLESKSFQTTQGIKILVEGKPIKALSVGSSGSVILRDLTVERFTLDSDASADISVLGLNSESLKLDISGSATVKISGKSKSVDLKSHGSSEVDASALVAQSVVVRASDASTALVNAAVDLNAVASESATIKYRGSARIKKQVSDAADIAKVN